ncbi:hypothetical protein HID58_000076 [Brassica napus]|uniref:Uncharacterized protein n=1 Tax=Brassica napus TaxID=3708 RepID=A0ABQ8EFI2_BRANA|nr:hypothetical protein HID58_000076 [Brassica napus]
MFVARRLHLSCKYGAANILRGKRVQSFNYSKSTKRSSGKTYVNPQLLIGTQTYPRSRLRYAAPALVLGFTGFIGFLHYNDERRAVPKGIYIEIFFFFFFFFEPHSQLSPERGPAPQRKGC